MLEGIRRNLFSPEVQKYVKERGGKDIKAIKDGISGAIDTFRQAQKIAQSSDPDKAKQLIELGKEKLPQITASVKQAPEKWAELKDVFHGNKELPENIGETITAEVLDKATEENKPEERIVNPPAIDDSQKPKFAGFQSLRGWLDKFNPNSRAAKSPPDEEQTSVVGFYSLLPSSINQRQPLPITLSPKEMQEVLDRAKNDEAHNFTNSDTASGLQNAHLVGANLQGLVFEEFNLTGANLNQADLNGANLFRANLTGATAEEANFSGTPPLRFKPVSPESSIKPKTSRRIFGGYLENFEKAAQGMFEQIMNQSLRSNGSSLPTPGANLQEANLTNANLAKANLTAADLSNAVAQNTNLGDSELNGTNLINTTLTNSNLSRAEITQANLSGATIIGNYAEGTSFRDVAFDNKTHFGGGDVPGLYTDRETKLLSDFTQAIHTPKEQHQLLVRQSLDQATRSLDSKSAVQFVAKVLNNLPQEFWNELKTNKHHYSGKPKNYVTNLPESLKSYNSQITKEELSPLTELRKLYDSLFSRSEPLTQAEKNLLESTRGALNGNWLSSDYNLNPSSSFEEKQEKIKEFENAFKISFNKSDQT